MAATEEARNTQLSLSLKYQIALIVARIQKQTLRKSISHSPIKASTNRLFQFKEALPWATLRPRSSDNQRRYADLALPSRARLVNRDSAGVQIWGRAVAVADGVRLRELVVIPPYWTTTNPLRLIQS